ncbi:MAG: hypothetical protein ACAI44_21615 [Candidatus Sericytochromatia bacterium]
MDPTIGKTISKHTAAILSGLIADGADEAEVNIIAAALEAAASPKAAEEIVPGWQPFPALLSDKDFTFAEGTDQARTVRLKILGGDFYWSELLPAVNEWAAALYKGKALELMQAAQADPVGFILEMFSSIVKRPDGDRTKISFYQFAAETFSTEAVRIEPEFFAICPPDEQMGAVRRLVDVNHRNFTRWWGELPGLLRLELSSLYLNLIRSIQSVNESVITRMQLMTLEIQSTLLESGGLPDTGTAGSSPWQETSPLPI